jgi:predicted TIM-barrel fold metal-dependent hydrolase
MKEIIDAHVHIVPYEAGVSRGGKVKDLKHGAVELPSGQIFQVMPILCADSSFKAETLVKYLDTLHIEKAVILQGYLYGYFNEYVSETVKKWPDRFIGSMLLDPMTENVLDTLQHAAEELQLRVLKFECSEATGILGIYPDLKLDSERFMSIWEKANEYSLIGVIDPGGIGGLGYQIEAIDKASSSFPNMHFVITHIGCPTREVLTDPKKEQRWKEIIALGHKTNIWFDLSALPYLFQDEEYPYPTAQQVVKTVYDMIGPDKLLWGSDVPGNLSYATYLQLLGVIEQCPFFSEEDKQNIFKNNAIEAFQLNN